MKNDQPTNDNNNASLVVADSPTSTDNQLSHSSDPIEGEISLAALLKLPEPLQNEALRWQAALLPLLGKENKKGRGAKLAAIAEQFKCKPGWARKKFDRFEEKGLAGLINRRAAGSDFWETGEEKIGLSSEDQETLRTYCESNQRGNEAAIRKMREDWLVGTIRTNAPLDAVTGYPRGWSERNLARYAPDELSLAAARQGRSATDSKRSLVYTTRRDLYVGEYYLFDDIWHDHYVRLLDTRQLGRPLEFHGLDLASAYKMCWGMRLRRAVPDGKGGTKMESLKVEDFRFLLAGFLLTHGYNPRGTTLVVEHATTAIDEKTERILSIASNGAIKVERGGMQGASVHAGQYAGRAKGNFRIKAALESLGNLIHNECAFLPGQAGKDRQHAPEQLHGLLKHEDALLWAMSQMPEQRLQWIQWETCTLQQFQIFAAELYARINDRKEHRLEGWDERYVPDRRTGDMRRMSPLEVWRPGSRYLKPVRPHVAAMIVGTEGGKERTVRNGEIEINSCAISGDPVRFEAHQLQPRGKYLCVLNPFDTTLNVYDADNRYVATLQRITVPSRNNVDAVHEQCGRAEKALAQQVAPMRRRAMRQAQLKAGRHRTNLRVTDLSRPFTADEKAAEKERRALTAPMTAFLAGDGSDPYAEDAAVAAQVADEAPEQIEDEAPVVAPMEAFL
jgi:hypothetical protein